MIELAARANDLPLEFFARVIWQESRFQSDAVGPVTRSGQRAQGIAQFMPGTASERRLLDPVRSGAGAAEIRRIPERVAQPVRQSRACRRSLQCRARGGCRNGSPAPGGMPQETRHYVVAITGSTVDDWAAAGKNGKMPDRAPTSSCRELMALLRRAPNPFVTQLEQHVTLSAAQAVGRAACRRLQTATRRWRCMRARSSG